MRQIVLAAVVISACLILAGCGSSPIASGVIAPDFNVAAASNTLAASTKDTTTSVNLTVKAVGGFNAPVTLAFSVAGSSALNGSFTPNPVTPTPSGTGATLTITKAGGGNLPAGTYPIRITGTGGGKTEGFSLTLTVTPPPDFTIAVTGSPVSVLSGGTASYTVTLTSIGGFSSPITLAASGLPAGATATFGTNPVTPTAAGAQTTLSIATTAGTTLTGSYSPTITATGGATTPTFHVTLNVTGVSVSVLPASQTLLAGGTASYTVTVTPQSGFTGTVTLTTSGLPASISAGFTPPSLTFATGDTAKTSTLLLSSITGSPTLVNYPFTIVATAGTSTFSANATVIVQP